MGSVKTNIGHLESASGHRRADQSRVSLQHEVLPQSLHFEKPSPHIPWDSLPVRVVDKAIPWQANGRPRRAGVSSFGFTGTNAHVLIEEAPAASGIRRGRPGRLEDVAVTPEPVTHEQPVNVLALSARSPEALVALAQRYEAWLDAHPDVDLADVCLTAGTGRSHFEHRAALVVDSVQGAREGLAGWPRTGSDRVSLRGEHTNRPTTAWLFTGQGSQYPGMARELFDAEPVFAETVTRARTRSTDILPRPLLEVLFADRRDGAEKALRHTSFAQPALFAVEMGLARLWQSWGIEPDVVLGHSVGQYAAACVAGVFSLEDGARLMAERGRLFGSLPEGGRMVAVFTDAKHVEESPTNSRRCRSPPTTAPTRCCRVRVRIWNRSSPDSVTRESAAPGWRPATPSTRNCWSRCSTNSSRTHRSCSSLSRRCRWSATAPAPCSRPKPRSTPNTGGGIPVSRCNSPKVCVRWRRWDARC